MDPEGITSILRRLSALERRMDALVRPAKVAMVQAAPYRVRASLGLDDEGEGLLTDWLPVGVGRAGATRDWTPLTVGERCLVFSFGGEDPALVAQSVFSADFAPPSEDPDVDYTAWHDSAGTEVGRLKVDRAAKRVELVMGNTRLDFDGGGAGLIALTAGARVVRIRP